MWQEIIIAAKNAKEKEATTVCFLAYSHLIICAILVADLYIGLKGLTAVGPGGRREQERLAGM